MKRRILSIFLAAGLFGSVMAAAAPVGAQPPEVPAEPNIVDPVGDANYIGDNTTTPADVSSTADLLAVWFSNDDENIAVHVQTQVPPPSTATAVTYEIATNPGEGSAGSSEEGCLRFLINIPASQANGGTYQDDPFVRLVDRCNVGTSIFDDSVEGEFEIVEGPEGSGITTLSFPRSYTALLADGQTLTGPSAEAWTPTFGDHTLIGFGGPIVDDTEVGTDYTIAGEEEEKAKKKEKKSPPGKDDPPGKGKKKGCPKGKGKKKGACPGKKKAAACEDFQPGKLGAEAETITITDAATEEEPVEQTVALDASLADFLFLVQDPSRTYFNVQIDSDDPNVGLYALFEFPTRRDYDLELLHPDGSYAARSHDFNPFQETPAGDHGDNEGHGGESTASTEKLVGIATDDCGGWTVEAVNWLGEGGEFSIKLWLGSVEHDPQAEGEEPRD